MLQPAQPLPLEHSAPQLPKTLPPCRVPSHKMKAKYGLPEFYRKMQPLQGELASFCSWSTSGMQIDGKGKGVGSATWENYEYAIKVYLGYLVRFEKVAVPSLKLFTDPHSYVKYISFLDKKETSIVTIKNHISLAKKVVSWLACDASRAESLVFADVQQWYDALRVQLIQKIPRKRKDPGVLEEEGAWLPAEDVLALFEDLRLKALHMCKADELNPVQARALHDACLANCMLGYLPPIRLACLRSLQLPNEGIPCLDKDCKSSQCKGNRLAVKQAALWISLPHHKNQDKWDNAIIEVALPHQLDELLHEYLVRGHSMVAPGQPYVFANRKGLPFGDASSLTAYWHDLMKRLGCPAKFPPNRLRHIFVDERGGKDRAEGPTDKGAAQLMGNSVKQWSQSYDLKFHRREAAEAMEAMAPWREAMLKKAKGKQPAVPESEGQPSDGDLVIDLAESGDDEEDLGDQSVGDEVSEYESCDDSNVDLTGSACAFP